MVISVRQLNESNDNKPRVLVLSILPKLSQNKMIEILFQFDFSYELKFVIFFQAPQNSRHFSFSFSSLAVSNRGAFAFLLLDWLAGSRLPPGKIGNGFVYDISTYSTDSSVQNSSNISRKKERKRRRDVKGLKTDFLPKNEQAKLIQV